MTQKINIGLAVESGKSLSAIYIAQGLGGKIAIIDTDYVDHFSIPNIDVVTVDEPFNPSIFLSVIERLEDQGYDNIIIDSSSDEYAAHLEEAYNPKTDTFQFYYQNIHRKFMKRVAQSAMLNLMSSVPLGQ